MKKNMINLEISSAEELQKQLEEIVKEKKRRTGFAELVIYGSDILVRQFDLPYLKAQDLVNALKFDAVEILSLPMQAIKLDYKVFDSSENRIKGIFIAMPIEKLNEYTQSFIKTRIMPVKLTAGCLSELGKFFAINPEAIKNNFCFLDFPKPNTVNLAVFINGHCELIREIIYENFNEAERSILDSLNYSYGRSVTKQLSKIYFSGDMEGKEELVKRLEKKIEIEPKSSFTSHTHNPVKSTYLEFFSGFNLLKKFSVILPIRNGILLIEKVLLLAVLILCTITAVKIFKDSRSVKEAAYSINAKDYEYARNLQEKVRILKNGK